MTRLESVASSSTSRYSSFSDLLSAMAGGGKRMASWEKHSAGPTLRVPLVSVAAGGCSGGGLDGLSLRCLRVGFIV